MINLNILNQIRFFKKNYYSKTGIKLNEATDEVLIDTSNHEEVRRILFLGYLLIWHEKTFVQNITPPKEENLQRIV